MKPEQIAERLVTRKGGQIFSVVSRRKCKTKKDCPFIIEKISRYQGQLCEYASRKDVKQGIESGERSEPKLPPGVKESFYVGQVKFFRMFSGNICLAVNVSGNKLKSEYLRNGKSVDKKEVEDYLLASEKVVPKEKSEHQEDHTAAFVSVGVDNIIEIK